MIDEKTLEENSIPVKTYYRSISSLVEGVQKQYYTFIAEKGIILPVERISEKFKGLLSRMQMHECYRNCYEFMTSTLGHDEDYSYEYCEGEIWVANQVPLHHAWIKVNDIKNNKSWFIDPTLQAINQLNQTDTYIAFRSFSFKEFLDILLKSRVHGEVFNTWFYDKLNKK